MILKLFKKAVSAVWYRPGTAHRILAGPMRGLWFRCSENTGLAALYSGNEKDNQRVYAAVVRPGDVVVDAGANWGVHALYLARLAGAAGRVLAFEPHPQVVDELRWHVEKNDFKQVTIHGCGLLDTAGEIPFMLGESSKTSHVMGTHDKAEGRVVVVPCRTLDEVVAESGITALRLIKVDVEGAEGRLLKGAEKTILRFRPHLVVELHNPEQDLDVALLLQGWNYKIERVDGSAIKHLDRPWPDPEGVWGTLHASPM
ncbi:MAG: FkbM family methyltransferase [Verrucomicrobiota bacterium]